MRIREVKTGSGKQAIQVVSKRDGKLKVHRHIGSFETQSERSILRQKAEAFIQETSGQSSLLHLLASVRPSELKITESRPLFIYNLLSGVYDKIGFNLYSDSVIKDLVIARIYYPASKLETQEILSEFFGRHYAINTLYRHVKKGLKNGLKETFQKALVTCARTDLQDALHLVFYDVTTLYFESTLRQGLRECGFSKDHRAQETQIVVGLAVNSQGFPLYFDVFKGNTFEGHTFLPIIEGIQSLLGNPKLIVVADAAMISQKNIDQLLEKKIEFIVGARIANLSSSVIHTLSQTLSGHDGKICCVDYRGQRLVCSYSAKRAAKDKSDRLKQIVKAEAALASPGGLGRHYRFVEVIDRQYRLNSDLISKAEKLEGLKGYVTNTSLPDHVVIERYRDLWRIENSFRISKSDLKARPIFHRLDDSIKAHLVLVFAGLAISRYLEIKSGWSIKKILNISRKILTHKVTHSKTGESAFIETTIENPLLQAQIDRLKILGH